MLQGAWWWSTGCGIWLHWTVHCNSFSWWYSTFATLTHQIHFSKYRIHYAHSVCGKKEERWDGGVRCVGKGEVDMLGNGEPANLGTFVGQRGQAFQIYFSLRADGFALFVVTGSVLISVVPFVDIVTVCNSVAYVFTVTAGTARVYNALTHHCVSKFEGHEGEISKVFIIRFLKPPPRAPFLCCRSQVPVVWHIFLTYPLQITIANP